MKSLDKDPNVQFVREKQDIFALAIICQIIFVSKSYFVQPNVVCPVPVLPAVPTLWSPKTQLRIEIDSLVDMANVLM